MKNSKEYSERINKLYSSLKRCHPKVDSVVYDDPVDALVHAVVSERMSESATQSALKKFGEYFVDLNDLRVSRAEEIVEVLGEDTADTREVASSLTNALRAVFDKYNMVCLKGLKKVGKKPAKQILEKMSGVGRFAVGYCMLTSLQGHAIPLTQRMMDYLRSNELVYPEADERQVEAFLARQIPASNAYEFYALLRRESESRGGRIKRTTTRKSSKKRVARTRANRGKATKTRKLKK